MNTLTRLTTWAALAWGALAPLPAATSPQEIFTRLAEPTRPVPMAPEKRAAALPALALIPGGADMVLASAGAGGDTLELLRLLGEAPSAELAQQLGSIQSAALATGAGADALQSMLPLLLHASQIEQMQLCEQLWTRKANPAYAEAIHSGFARQMQLQQQAVLSAYLAAQLAPIYYAATAIPGREADFLALHRECLRRMQAAARQSDELTWVEIGGYAGLRLSQLTAYKWLMKSAPQDTAIRDALAQRELYLLTRAQGGMALTVLCEHPVDVAPPQEAVYSMLASPKLNGADACMEQLKFTGWCSATFYRALRLSMEAHHYPLTQAVLQALGNIAQVDQIPAHQPLYQEAARDIAWLVWQPPYFNEISTPLAVQVWQPQPGVLAMESVSGAQGMDFEQGELQYVDQAGSPGAVFYMESTAFSAPHPPHFGNMGDKVATALLGAAKGIAITLRAEEQQRVMPLLRYAEVFRPEVAAVSNAVQVMADGLGAPFALLAAQETGSTAAAQPDMAWAFCAAVHGRPNLSGGWEQLLSTAALALGKLGIAPELVRSLPITDVPLGPTAREHALDLPGIGAKLLPRVAVSDSRFVLGNSSAYNAQLINSTGAPMRFKGAVSAIDIPHLASCLSRVNMSGCGPILQRVPQALNRLAERARTLYSVSTIRQGIRTARGLLLLK